MVHRASSAAYTAMVGELLDGPSTVKELIAVSGMHENTVRKFLTAMRHARRIKKAGADNRSVVWALVVPTKEKRQRLSLVKSLRELADTIEKERP